MASELINVLIEIEKLVESFSSLDSYEALIKNIKTQIKAPIKIALKVFIILPPFVYFQTFFLLILFEPAVTMFYCSTTCWGQFV